MAIALLARRNYGNHALRPHHAQVVLPHDVAVARISHALHHAGGNAADDLPDAARRQTRVLANQGHAPTIREWHDDRRPRERAIGEVKHAGRRPTLERGLIRVRQSVCLPGHDAVTTTEEVVNQEAAEHQHNDEAD